MVVSVSRRCDIPRFAFDWFLERLEEGFVEVKNPFNSRQIKRVSLLPPGPGRPPREQAECAEALAFWTRDPSFILAHAEDLKQRKYGFFVMTTLNSYPAILEPNVPAAEAVIQTMKKLAQKISPDRVLWRYDPVFLSDQTDFEFHRANFAFLATRLKAAVKRVIVSVYDEYPRAEKRLAALESSGALKRPAHSSPDLRSEGRGPEGRSLEGRRSESCGPEVRGLLAELAAIARGEGMEIQSCAEEDFSDCGIPSGACIDGEYLAKEFAIENPGKDRGQKRPYCLCAQSVDIGSYGRCPAGCVYCYASTG